VAIASVFVDYAHKTITLDYIDIEKMAGRYLLCAKHANEQVPLYGWKFEKKIGELVTDGDAAPITTTKSTLTNQVKPNAGIIETDDTSKTSLKKNGAQSPARRRLKPLIPDDDMTAIMRHLNETYSAPDLPVANRGIQKGNLVAYRTGETGVQLSAVGTRENLDEQAILDSFTYEKD
jgi:hypothetical protein